MSNPFVLVYDALWDLAEDCERLTSLVKPRNRIKFQGTKRDPIKDEASQGDLPELVLVSTGFQGNIHQTSTGSKIIRNYEWIIATGDMIIAAGLLDVEWALFAAMCDWQRVLGGLRWNDESFVKRADVTSVDNGLTDPDRNRGIRGWSALWRCEVEMHLRTRDVVADCALPTTTTEGA